MEGAAIITLSGNHHHVHSWADLQVGLAEMQTAVEQTGGLLVQASTFNAQAFKESFRRIFAPPTEEGHLGMNSNAHFEVGCPGVQHAVSALFVTLVDVLTSHPR